MARLQFEAPAPRQLGEEPVRKGRSWPAVFFGVWVTFVLVVAFMLPLDALPVWLQLIFFVPLGVLLVVCVVAAIADVVDGDS